MLFQQNIPTKTIQVFRLICERPVPFTPSVSLFRSVPIKISLFFTTLDAPSLFYAFLALAEILSFRTHFRILLLCFRYTLCVAWWLQRRRNKGKKSTHDERCYITYGRFLSFVRVRVHSLNWIDMISFGSSSVRVCVCGLTVRGKKTLETAAIDRGNILAGCVYPMDPFNWVLWSFYRGLDNFNGTFFGFSWIFFPFPFKMLFNSICNGHLTETAFGDHFHRKYFFLSVSIKNAEISAKSSNAYIFIPTGTRRPRENRECDKKLKWLQAAFVYSDTCTCVPLSST